MVCIFYMKFSDAIENQYEPQIDFVINLLHTLSLSLRLSLH